MGGMEPRGMGNSSVQLSYPLANGRGNNRKTLLER